MAKAKKMPSGNWRIQVCCKGEKASFTADTKQKAELMASEWANGIRQKLVDDPTLEHAIDEYIKNDVLSPSTLMGYTTDYHRIQKYPISKKRLSSIRTADLQRFVKTLSGKYSPKTVRNTYGLLTATLRFYDVPVAGSITLPRKTAKSYRLPSDDDLRHILGKCKGTDMEIAISLAAFGGMRRSEILALTSDDVDFKNNTVSIHAAVVRGADNKLHTKGTKTESSTRIIMLPKSVMNLMKGKEGLVCPLTPATLTKRWRELATQAGIDSRFHDLRHYSASRAHAIGIPDQYIMGRHGWKSDYALKSIYRNELDDVTKAMNKKITDDIEKTFSPKFSPKTRRRPKNKAIS